MLVALGFVYICWLEILIISVSYIGLDMSPRFCQVLLLLVLSLSLFSEHRVVLYFPVILSLSLYFLLCACCVLSPLCGAMRTM